MRKKSILIHLLLFFLIATNTGRLGAEANGKTFVGKAVNSKGILEYVEYYTVKYEEGKVSESQTVYYDPLGQKIGDLTSEYSFGPQFGGYRFRDIRAKYEDGVKVSANQIWLFRKRGAEQDAEEKRLQRQQDQIVGQGYRKGG